MKQKISPVGTIIVLLAVIAVVGTLWYRFSEPPLVNVPKKSQEQMVRDGQTGMAGFKAMFENAAKAKKNKPDAKGKPDVKGTDDKAATAASKSPETSK